MRLTGLERAENVFMRALPRRAHSGSTRFGKMGDVVQQPPVWAGLAGALALAGGPRGQRAALRGSACYGVAAIVANLVVKPLAERSRPPGSSGGRPGPVTSSFPSGHAATDLAFTIGVAQEIPALFLPLAVATSAGHWSLVRSRGHYPTDVLAGGVVGLAVGLAMWKVWPPRREGREEPVSSPSPTVIATTRPVSTETPVSAPVPVQPAPSGDGVGGEA